MEWSILPSVLKEQCRRNKDRWISTKALWIEPPACNNCTQECIPVGCVPDANWLSRGGGGGWCIPEGFFFGEKKLKKEKKIWRPPKIWKPPENLDEPPQNLEEPPQKIWRTPKNLETPPKKIWRPPKIWRHPPGPDPHPPWTEFLTHASENITLAQLRCGR